MNRLRRLRRDDDGSALIFVLLLSMIVMITLATTSTTLLSQIKPTTDAIQTGEAYAAAEAGIEDFTAKINNKCSDDDSFACAWAAVGTTNTSVSNPKTQVGQVFAGADGATTHEAFVWTVRSSASGFARVVSVGQALDGAGSVAKTRTLVADLGATPSFNNFEYFTKYETFPADFVNSFYGPRSIQVTSDGAASGSSLPGAGLLQWNGTCTYVSATATPDCDPNHDTGICNDLYYPTDDGPGRGTDTAWNNSVRRPSTAVQSAMGTDSTFAYYSEQGTFTPTNGSPVGETHNDVCDSTFEPNMEMDGPIYSQDAYLIDRGDDTGNSGNSMPVFGGSAYSMWNGVINGAQQAKGANQGYDRAYPTTDGQISTSLSPQPVYTTDKLELPPNADSAKPLATCTYYGPTRILIKQNIAYITSPQTPTTPSPAGASYCYESTGSFSNATGGGVVDAAVPISSTIIYVANPTTSSHPVATPTSPIFHLTANIPAPAATGSDTLAGTWTDNSTYSSSQTCPSAPAPTTRRNFDCETSPSSPASNMAKAISDAVDATMKAGASSASAMSTNLQTAIKAQLKSSVLTEPTTWTTSNYYYTVTATAATPTTTTTTAPALSPSDPWYQPGATTSFTTTKMSATISIDRIACTSPNNNGDCQGHQTDTPIYKGSATGSWSSGTAATSSVSWPWFGAQTGATTYTDPNNDITPYYDNYGDAYVEGTLKGNLTIVAEHDIVATNDIAYSDENVATTTDGLVLVADHDVRIYRPMNCTDDGTAGVTTKGYCPDDLTGVFSTPLSWPLPNNYPALKYVPTPNAPAMFTPSKTQGTLEGAIFTLRGCFMVDNFYRGGTGYSANIVGGLYQYHRGPTSLPYQGRPYQGSKTKMPGVVVSYTYDNLRAGQTSNGGLRVPWLPAPDGRPVGSTRTWNVVNVATGS